MPYIPPINEGLLGDIVGNLENLVPDLPGPIDDALKHAVNTAVLVVDPTMPTPALPENPTALPPETTAEHKTQIVTAIDTIISAIGVALKFRFLIPDQYEKPLETLAKALEKVRSWID